MVALHRKIVCIRIAGFAFGRDLLLSFKRLGPHAAGGKSTIPSIHGAAFIVSVRCSGAFLATPMGLIQGVS
jgi:hypothetical protein